MPAPNVDIETHQAAKHSPLIWSVRNIALPEGPWDFTERRWQIDIFEDMWPEIVCEKAAQRGLTTIFLLKTLHFLDQNKATRGMYTLPRQADLYTFVPARLVPLIQGSPYLRNIVGKSKEDPQGVRLKRIGRSFIYFCEASVEPREVPVDILNHDEIDRSHQDYLDMFKARMDASRFAYCYRFSTPTIPGFGIDRAFEESDKRYWFIRCPHCNREQTLEWDKTLAFDKEHTPYYGCEKCRGVLSPECIIDGHWVPTAISAVHGYHVSHLMHPISKPPAVLYHESCTMKPRNFANLRLGITHVASVGGMPFELFDICFSLPYKRELAPDGQSPYYMGIDQANDIHVLIGKLEKKVIKVVQARVIRFTNENSWDVVKRIIEKWKPVCCVIDALPNRHNVKALQLEFDRRQIYAAFYPTSLLSSETMRTEKKGNQYLIHLHHTDSFDELRDSIRNGEMSLWGRRRDENPLVFDVISHCNNLKRDEEDRKTRIGVVTVGVWRKTGPVHFASCLNYLRAAARLKKQVRLEVREIGEKKERPIAR